MIKYLA